MCKLLLSLSLQSASVNLSIPSHYCTLKKFSIYFAFLLLQQLNLPSSMNSSSRVQLRYNRFGSINCQKINFPCNSQKKLQINWTFLSTFFKNPIINNLLGHSTSLCHTSSYRREAEFTCNSVEKEKTNWERQTCLSANFQ